MAGATAVFFINADEADTILDDASAQRFCCDAPRGTIKAYASLAENLVKQVDRERNRGLIPDPGYEVAKARDAEGWRPLKVGDVAVHYKGETLLIIRGYDYELILGKTCRYVCSDGLRREYRWGYSAKVLTGNHAGEEYFFPAHEIRSARSEITHVRLVD